MAILSPASVMPPAPKLFLPEKAPGAIFQYGYDAIADITAPDGTVDAITSVSISVKPSGAGELAITNIDVQNTIISFYLSGGVAGRTYILKLLFTTVSSPTTYEIDLGVVCPPLLAAYPVPPPPDFGFGTATTWP